MKKTWLWMLGTVILATSCNNHQNINTPRDELPVSRVVMYQSGIGYVERSAVVDDDELVLRIRPDQINDVLKSLTVIDRNNGRPVSISLPVDHTTIDALSQIPGQIREGGIRSLLDAFRGANVHVKTKRDAADGRIVGVESHYVPAKSGETTEDKTTVTILNENDVLKVIDVSDIKSVTLHDKTLADGLNKSLNISLNEGNWKQIELRIHMDSDKKREIAMSYLVAMPTWKPAYRLILDDNNKGTIQGWAIISNVSGADWNDIEFSLISGQPMSFTYNLYQPKFLSRPDLSHLGVQRAEAPVVAESGYAALEKPLRRHSKSSYPRHKYDAVNALGNAQYAEEEYEESAPEEGVFGADAPAAEPDFFKRKYGTPAGSGVIRDEEIASNFNELADNSQLGSFDEYTLNSKLTIPDGNTALVNLIQKKVSARDTRMFKSIENISDFSGFYKGWRESTSYQTIELANDIGVSLDSGPITIYKDSAVIGEGYLSRTEKGASAFITFAKEGRIAVEVTDQVSENTQYLTNVENGYCQYENETKITKTFTFTSQIPDKITSLLTLPKFSDWKPVNFPDNIVTTDSSYLISAEIPASGAIDVPLTMLSSNTYAHRPLNPKRGTSQCTEVIKNAIDKGAITGDQLDLFKQYVADIEAHETNRIKLKNLDSQASEIESDQESLSKTLKDLKDIKTANADTLKKQLVSRQQSNEKRLVDITTQAYATRITQSEIELRMNEYVKKLSYHRQPKVRK